jgi:molybdopterin biosynthesis enzyme MoaB
VRQSAVDPYPAGRRCEREPGGIANADARWGLDGSTHRHVVTTGGTGVTIDDVTPAACEGLFEREIPGFGELFRVVSYEEIGHRAMASRATAGVVSGTPTFCLPGSRGAVRTGMAELVLPEAPHLAGLVTRHRFDRHATDAEP